MSPALSVRPITAQEHLDFVRSATAAGGAVSFLQTPGWGAVKAEWLAESLGWFREGEERPVGAALVLYRQLPRVRRYLAYVPEGPVIDWQQDGLDGWLQPLVEHVRSRRAFGLRIGPPVVTCRWTAAQVKEGIADDAVRTLAQVAPEERSATGAGVVSQLAELGWQRQQVEGGFAAGQPSHVFQIPLVDAEGVQRTEEDVLRGMNQQWRRNIKKADKQGVEVTTGSAGADLKAFHDLYVHTARRDGFTPRPLSYFETMFGALSDDGSAESPVETRLYLAHHEGDLVASTIWIRVGRHVWYSYGASSTEKREVRGSNAVQWQMIRDALAAGATVYDLRGITDTLDADDSHVGLIQFKVGTGGEAVEYAGEWDLALPGVLNRALYAAFAAYLRRR